MELSHPAYHGLARLLIGLRTERRILLRKLRQRHPKLIHILLRLRLHRQLNHRIREHHRLQRHGRILRAYRISSPQILKSHRRAYITGLAHVYRVLLVRVHLVQAANTLLLTRTHVVNVATAIQMSRVHPDVRQSPNERIRGYLERQTAERLIHAGITMHLLPRVHIRPLNASYIQRAGKELHHRIQQSLNPDVARRRPAKHGHRLHAYRRLPQSRQDLLLRNRTRILKKPLHQRIVELRHRLQHVVTPLLRLSLQVRRDRYHIHHGILIRPLPAIRLLLNQIHHAHKASLTAYWNLHRYRIRPKAIANLLNHRVVVCTHTVHLIHERQLRYTILIRLTPHRLALRLYSTHSAKNRYRTVKNAERTLHLHREINVPRRIYDVYLIRLTIVLPERRGRSRCNRYSPLLLLLHPVHRRRTLVRLAYLVRLTRIVQYALRRRRLPSIDMRHYPYVPGIR